MKMEQAECSETSAYKIQTPGNYPKERIQHTEQGESLILRMLHYLCSGVVELIATVQTQRINDREYSNSYTINDECRQTVVCIDSAM